MYFTLYIRCVSTNVICIKHKSTINGIFTIITFRYLIKSLFPIPTKTVMTEHYFYTIRQPCTKILQKQIFFFLCHILIFFFTRTIRVVDIPNITIVRYNINPARKLNILMPVILKMYCLYISVANCHTVWGT